MDSVIGDFLARFGDKNRKREEKYRGSGLIKRGKIDRAFKRGFDPMKQDASTFGAATLEEASDDRLQFGEVLGDIASVGSDLLQAAPGVMGTISGIKGDNLDTSATGGGPGDAAGHIMNTAMMGADAGGKIGSLIPGGQIPGKFIGGLIGGIGAIGAHTGAKKEWRNNQKNYNVAKDDMANKELNDSYQIGQGLAAIEASKNLRRKQLGLLDT